jgi:hypothetical protein
MNSRASQGEQIAGLSGVALILIMLLFAWYGLEGAPDEVNGIDAFDAYGDWLNLILLATAFSGISLAMFGAAASRLRTPMSLSVVTAALGALSAVLIFIFLLSTPSISFGAPDDFDTERKIGVFLGLLAALGIAAGGYLAMQDEGTSFQDAADRLTERGRRERPSAAAPPPPPAAEPPPPSAEPPPRSEPPPPPPPPPSGRP